MFYANNFQGNFEGRKFILKENISISFLQIIALR